jgi:hypothetical protein
MHGVNIKPIHIYYFHLDCVITFFLVFYNAYISVALYTSRTQIFCDVIPGYKLISWDI